MKIFIATLLCITTCISCFADNTSNKIDSLEAVLKIQTRLDSNRVKTLLALNNVSKDQSKKWNLITEAYTISKKTGYKKGEFNSLIIYSDLYVDKGNPDSATLKLTMAFDIATLLNDPKLKGQYYLCIANIEKDKSSFEQATKHYVLGIKEFQKAKDIKRIADSYNNLGLLYSDKGESALALSNFLKALTNREKINDLKGQAGTLGNIGLVYTQMKMDKLSYSFYRKSYLLGLSLNEKKIAANACINIANIFSEGTLLSKDSALFYFAKAENIYNEINNLRGLAKVYNNKGILYVSLSEFSKALEQFELALPLKKQMIDSLGIASVYINMANALTGLKKYNLALMYTDSSKTIFKKLQVKDAIVVLITTYFNIYSEMKDVGRMVYYFKRHAAVKDSFLTSESTQQIAEMQAKFDSDKQKSQLELQDAKLNQQKSEISKQKNITYSIIGIAVLVLLLAVVSYRSYKNSQKKNDLLTLQKAAISEQKKEIQDSINYAKNIQSAVLPDFSLSKNYFEEAFCLYMPKDVISGDFFWLSEKKDSIYIAAGDCTGHGVPGALMSILSIEKLNSAVLNSNNSPSEILSSINMSIKNSLKQSQEGSDSRDGLDIALIHYNKAENKMVYAGANRPCYLYREGILTEYSPTKTSIGGHTIDAFDFKNNELILQKNDTVYIFSDGYADQFGGEKGKKITTKTLKTVLTSIQSLPLNEQQEKLNQFYLNWKGNLEQIDDVLVIGLKV